MSVITPPTFRIKHIEWTLDRPAQINRSAYTGKRTVVANPWHGKWSAKVEFPIIQGQGNAAPWRAFVAQLKGSINMFRLPATEAAQNNNSGVVLSANAAQGATTATINGWGTAMLAGQYVTIAGQLLLLTVDQSGSTITFEPPLRAAANAGAVVVTSAPYALVYMASSSAGWTVDPGRLYGFGFEAEEAIAETDAAPPEQPALHLDFKNGIYVSNGVGVAVTAMPGYSFTRTGTQYELDAVAGQPLRSFIDNVPAIVPNVGYWGHSACTNSLLQSQAFDNVSWTKSGCAITANAIAAPDGTLTADKVVVSAVGGGGADIQQGVAKPANVSQTWTASVFFKQGEWAFATVQMDDGANGMFAIFNLSTGTIDTAATALGTGFTAGAAYIINVGGGWYKCIVVATVNTAAVTLNQTTWLSNVNSRINSVAGGGTNGIYLWQAQLMQGNFADGSEIIPTTTAAASVGAPSFSVGDSAADQNQIFLVTDVPNVIGSASPTVATWFNVGNTQSYQFNMVAGKPSLASTGYNPTAASAVAAGATVTLVLQRLSGASRFGYVVSGVLTWVDAGATVAGVAIDHVTLGTDSNPITSVKRRLGTFSDAQIIAMAG